MHSTDPNNTASFPPPVAEPHVSFNAASSLPRARPTRYPVLTAFGPSSFPAFVHTPPHPGTPFNPGRTVTSPSPSSFTPPPIYPPEISIIEVDDTIEALERAATCSRSILDRSGSPACPETFMMTDAEDAEAERRRSRDVFRHRGNGAHVVRVDDVEGYVVPLPGRDGRPGRNSPEATRRRRWQVVDGDAEGVERVRMEEPEEEEREEKAGCCCGLGAVGKRIRLAMGRLGSGWRREEGKKRSRRSWDMAAVKMQ